MKLRIPVLRLDRPLSIDGDRDFLAATDEKRVQLEADQDLQGLTGRTVVVTGTLRGPITATHVMAIVVVVESIAPAP